MLVTGLTAWSRPVLSCRGVAWCGQVNQLLEVGDKNAGMQKYTAMDKWANQVKGIHTTVCNKVY
jgi:hypothetical protein